MPRFHANTHFLIAHGLISMSGMAMFTPPLICYRKLTRSNKSPYLYIYKSPRGSRKRTLRLTFSAHQHVMKQKMWDAVCAFACLCSINIRSLSKSKYLLSDNKSNNNLKYIQSV